MITNKMKEELISAPKGNSKVTGTKKKKKLYVAHEWVLMLYVNSYLYV